MRLDGLKLQEAIKMLIAEYKYDPMMVLDIVKLGIRTAYKKDYMPHDRKGLIQIAIGGDGAIKIYREYDVVETIEEEDQEMLIKEATTHKADAQLGDKIYLDVTPDPLEFTRVAVQAAGQTIKQNLKNIERERFYEKFQDKQGELLKAKVLRVIAESIVLDVEGVTVVLPPEGQIPNRVYHSGEEIIVFLKQIAKGVGGIMLDITQSGTDFIEALLHRIVPELEQGKVFIDKIVRVTGRRTKIVVGANDEKIDPVGVFVGMKGDRISTILSLLDGEKIDFIEYSGDETKFIMDCLKPAKVDSIKIDGKKVKIYLPEDQKSMAIGKGASNIKLAGMLTGYRLELV